MKKIYKLSSTLRTQMVLLDSHVVLFDWNLWNISKTNTNKHQQHLNTLWEKTHHIIRILIFHSVHSVQKMTPTKNTPPQVTPPKSNIDTQKDGFLDVSPFKHGVILGIYVRFQGG